MIEPSRAKCRSRQRAMGQELMSNSLGSPVDLATNQAVRGEINNAEIVVERYKYILQQINSLNENVYRFLGMFQTVATALVTAALAVFIGYRKWGISVDTATVGVRALLVLLTVVAAFGIVLIVIGTFSWVDYRREECELTSKYFATDFRRPPRLANFWRWYETYMVLLIVSVTVALWFLVETLLIPRMT